MKSILLKIVLLTFLQASTPTSNRTKTANLKCTLTSNKTKYKVGELPVFKVEILNSGKSDIYLIGSLDGSDVKLRFPYCYYTIDKPKPDTIKVFGCGNVNTLKIEDFRLVKAGQKFNPYEHIDDYRFFEDYATTDPRTFRNSGIYKIKFHYSTNSLNFSDFISDKPYRQDKLDSLRLTSALKEIPKIDIASNEIQIQITD